MAEDDAAPKEAQGMQGKVKEEGGTGASGRRQRRRRNFDGKITGDNDGANEAPR